MAQHSHAELLRWIADGKQIEWEAAGNGVWRAVDHIVVLAHLAQPWPQELARFRIKPIVACRDNSLLPEDTDVSAHLMPPGPGADHSHLYESESKKTADRLMQSARAVEEMQQRERAAREAYEAEQNAINLIFPQHGNQGLAVHDAITGTVMAHIPIERLYQAFARRLIADLEYDRRLKKRKADHE